MLGNSTVNRQFFSCAKSSSSKIANIVNTTKAIASSQSLIYVPNSKYHSRNIHCVCPIGSTSKLQSMTLQNGTKSYSTEVVKSEKKNNIMKIDVNDSTMVEDILGSNDTEEWYHRDYLSPKQFYESLVKRGMESFYGVPDSLLKDFCGYVDDHASAENHIIASNEGNAIALAAGYHLATNKFPVVYLQNSGLGNIVNPILSLAMPEIYSIPMCIFIGWRGEPGKKDEPQHLVQGKATPSLLASLNIPFEILPDFHEGAEKVLNRAKEHMVNEKGPFVILVRKRTFLKYKSIKTRQQDLQHTRESALNVVVKELNPTDCVVGSTGMLSRELFEYRSNNNQGHARDFLTVGSMGHASCIALGIATAIPKKNVYCLDGDGSTIMHMGAMTTIGSMGLGNLKHIIFNNAAHDSVGGQSTACSNPDFSFTKIALGCGYKQAITCSTTEEIVKGIKLLKENRQGSILLEIKIKTGSRKDLGRPTRTPLENKIDFMNFIQTTK